jgi:hypothetical protein
MTTAVESYAPLERIAFPDGSELFYKDSDHSYWRRHTRKPDRTCGGSGRLTGISTVCGPLDFRPDNLMRWVERLTLEGVARGFQERAVPADPYVLRQALEADGLRYEQIRDEAAKRGTDVHKLMVHALATGEEAPDLSELPEEQRGYGQAVMRWWMDRDPDPIQAEQCVLVDEHGCAGRFDLRARVTGRLDGGTWLADFKTGNFIPTKAHAQVAGYDLGVIACGLGEPADRLLIVQVHEDGTYSEIPVCATHEDFLVAVETYRAAARIGKAARQARELAEAQRT